MENFSFGIVDNFLDEVYIEKCHQKLPSKQARASPIRIYIGPRKEKKYILKEQSPLIYPLFWSRSYVDSCLLGLE